MLDLTPMIPWKPFFLEQIIQGAGFTILLNNICMYLWLKSEAWIVCRRNAGWNPTIGILDSTYSEQEIWPGYVITCPLFLRQDQLCFCFQW